MNKRTLITTAAAIFAASTFVAASASAETIGSAYDLSGTTGAFEINNAATSQALFLCLGTMDGDTAATDCRNLVVRIVKHAFADLSS